MKAFTAAKTFLAVLPVPRGGNCQIGFFYGEV
jgi:hypothetical protein